MGEAGNATALLGSGARHWCLLILVRQWAVWCVRVLNLMPVCHSLMPLCSLRATSMGVPWPYHSTPPTLSDDLG